MPKSIPSNFTIADSQGSQRTQVTQYTGFKVRVEPKSDSQRSLLPKNMFKRVCSFGTDITASSWGSSKQKWGTIVTPPHFKQERKLTETEVDDLIDRLYPYNNQSRKTDKEEGLPIVFMHKTFITKKHQDEHANRLAEIPERWKEDLRHQRRKKLQRRI